MDTISRALEWFIARLAQLVVPAWWRTAGERAVSQAIEAFLAVATIGGVTAGITDVDWRTAIGLGLGGALASLVMSLVSLPAPDSVTRPVAILYRVIRTIAAAAAPVLTAAALNVFDFDWPHALNIIGLTALIAIAKMFIFTPTEQQTSAPATPAPAVERPADDALKAELQAFAAAHNIAYNTKTTKAQLWELIDGWYVEHS